ncbi:MAG: glycosyltransferase [Acidimicrobiia bacterium]
MTQARIVQIGNGSRSGGVWRFFEETGRAYTNLGIDRVLIYPGPVDGDERTSDRGRIITVATPELPGSGGYRMMLGSPRVRRILDALMDHPDCHLEVSDKGALYWLGHWASARCVPTVLFSHERLADGLGARLPDLVPTQRMSRFWNQRHAGAFDRIVCGSDYAAAEFRALGFDQIDIVPIGVDLERFSPSRRARPASPSAPELLVAARLAPEKRIDLVIDAVRELRADDLDVRLTICGEGPLREQLMTQAEGLPVTFVGQIDVDALAIRFANADLVIGPSPTETFGLSVVEAMASGTPVVVNAGGALPEVVGPAVGVGAQIADSDPHAFAAAIRRQLELPADAARVAARGRAEMFPWSATAEGMLHSHGIVREYSRSSHERLLGADNLPRRFALKGMKARSLEQSIQRSLDQLRELAANGDDLNGASRIAAWSAETDPAMVLMMAELAPEFIGSLDGIPPSARYHANRRAISDERLKPTELRRLEPETLTALSTRRLHRRGYSVDRQMMLFDPSDANAIRVAEVFGDLESARAAAVMIPGNSIGPDEFVRWRRRSERLAQVASDHAGAEVAVVAWLGFRTPELAGGLDRRIARSAGLELARFLAGFDPSRTRRITLVGHSCGAAVVGEATRAGAQYDAAVLVGATSTHAFRGADVAVHTLMSSTDYANAFATVGWDPTGARIGAERLRTGMGVAGHSRYFGTGTESMRAIARVIADGVERRPDQRRVSNLLVVDR